MPGEDLLPLSDFSALRITTTLHMFSKTSPDGLNAGILLLTWKGSPQRSRQHEAHEGGWGSERGAGCRGKGVGEFHNGIWNCSFLGKRVENAGNYYGVGTIWCAADVPARSVVKEKVSRPGTSADRGQCKLAVCYKALERLKPGQLGKTQL